MSDDVEPVLDDTDGFFQYEPDKSDYPAYHFRMSAHDLALYGTLFLNGGKWKDQQIIPQDWIAASAKPYSVTNPRIGIGYGMLWNVMLDDENRNRSTSFFHTGTGVHMLAVYPQSGFVMVHRVDTEREYSFTPERLYKIISLVFSARLK